MYVCICNGLTSRQVRGAIHAGAASVEAVYLGCGVRPRCGQCGPAIHSLLVDTATPERPGAEVPLVALAATAA